MDGGAVSESLPAEELAGRYRAGATIDDLAALYQSYPYRVRRTLVAAGVEIRPPGAVAAGLDRDPRGRGVRAVRRPVGELVERYRAGAALDDLAILCSCASNKVRRILIAAGVEIRPRSGVAPKEALHPAPPVMPPTAQYRAGRLSDQAAHDLLRTGELAGRYRGGASLEDLAIRYRCSPNKIRSLLFRASVVMRPPGRKPATSVRHRRDGGTAAISMPVGELAERYLAGATLVELAVLCACSSGTVRSILIAAGVARRRPGRPITSRTKP
jgi:uncharacterized protein (DUF433 family)